MWADQDPVKLWDFVLAIMNILVMFLIIWGIQRGRINLPSAARSKSHV
jgi:hypothetical protein